VGAPLDRAPELGGAAAVAREFLPERVVHSGECSAQAVHLVCRDRERRLSWSGPRAAEARELLFDEKLGLAAELGGQANLEAEGAYC
jgi:hypothetical protein